MRPRLLGWRGLLVALVTGPAVIALALMVGPARPGGTWLSPCRTVPADAKALCMSSLQDDAERDNNLLIRAMDAARNSGLVRRFSDGSAVISGLRRAVSKPELVGAYFTPNDTRTDIQYGSLEEHRLDVVFRRSHSKAPRPVLLFVHGGAWGSGSKLFYRSFARRLSDAVDCTVAVVGYPVYPSATAWGQVSSVALATRWARSKTGTEVLGRKDVDAGVIICGHSSGGHITSLSALWAAEDLAQNEPTGQPSSEAPPPLKHMIHTSRDPKKLATVLPDGFVGLAGVYDIGQHYAFEESRGVADVSPMKPACGGSRVLFDRLSPRQEVNRISDAAVKLVPPMLFMHGEMDGVVPISSSRLMASALKKARERAGDDTSVDSFVAVNCGHAEVVTEIAFMEDATPAADAVFPVIRSFVDRMAAEVRIAG